MLNRRRLLVGLGLFGLAGPGWARDSMNTRDFKRYRKAILVAKWEGRKAADYFMLTLPSYQKAVGFG